MWKIVFGFLPSSVLQFFRDILKSNRTQMLMKRVRLSAVNLRPPDLMMYSYY